MNNDNIKTTDYGPLSQLIGKWEGNQGKDIAPEPDGIEENPYYEYITFEPVRAVTNAEQQTLLALRYHQEVRRKSNDLVFHDQVGYWLWEPGSNEIVQTINIPRGVVLVAGGTIEKNIGGGFTFNVVSKNDHDKWRIQQTPFMNKNARTVKFEHTLSVSEKEIVYKETTWIDIYGKESFEHSDTNVLSRV
ncbi:MAG: heme-binding beta-barrel domain-containing protein [Bdellovibrionota bacterium]